VAAVAQVLQEEMLFFKLLALVELVFRLLLLVLVSLELAVAAAVRLMRPVVLLLQEQLVLAAVV
jgi:hypothetical protein